MKKRVLFLMSDTGGGHRAAAEAIRDALTWQYGEQAVQVELVDVFRDYSPVPLKFMPEFYPIWMNHSKSSWGAGYNFSNTRRRAQILSTTLYATLESGLKRMLREHPADVIVSVHSVLTRPAMKALQSRAYRPPFVVVVTDLVSTHHLWYDRRAERCLVPTQPAYQRGLESGMLPSQLRVTGLPVNPRFIHGLTDRASARQKLGWDSELPAVLIVGGGDGMGPVYRTARAIDDARFKCQLIIVAGRNDSLRRQLNEHDWNQPTQIYGFRNDMPILMAGTDILVSKAGPATITEAGIAGLPVILYDAIPGQETGNVDHVVQNDIGVFAPTPEEITAALRKWLAEGPEGLRSRSERARHISRPNAVFDIATEIWHYAQQKPIAIPKRDLLKEVAADATRLLSKEL